MSDQAKTHETGTRRLSLWRSTANGSSHGDQARGYAREAVYLSDDEAGCAEVSIYVVENMDGGEPCASYGVEERATIGAAIFEDGSWRADDSADIIYDWADALTYDTLESAQAAADRCGTLDLSWALNLRGGPKNDDETGG